MRGRGRWRREGGGWGSWKEGHRREKREAGGRGGREGGERRREGGRLG